MALRRASHFFGKAKFLQPLTLEMTPSRGPITGTFKPDLFIFDKDGTLVCFHTMWNPWCESLTERLNKKTGFECTKDVNDMLGYDSVNRKVKLGALAEETPNQIKEKLTNLLIKRFKLGSSEALTVLETTWQDVPENMQIKLVADLSCLFSRLKRNHVKIAICTSDSRASTQEFLSRENLSGFVDMLVCGDDPESIPKPDPHNALTICKQLGVDVRKTVMIGDTPTDIQFGKRANLGLTIGVKSGIGNEEDLKDANVIVRDIKDFIDQIFPESETSK